VHGAADADRREARFRSPRKADATPILTLRAAGPGRILIRAGSFVMGSNAEEIELAIELCKKDWRGADFCEKQFVNELEAHEVMLSAYYIDRTEVTVGAYRDA